MNDTTRRIREDGDASGRFVLRIDPDLHAALREAARAAGTSLNEYCTRKLSIPTSEWVGPAITAVTRAHAVVGKALLGVVAFGSWARQEMGEKSDVDLLVIVEAGQEIDRGLYKSWDEEPLRWDGHLLEPHFVHLPEAGSRLSGLWAEVAVDGLVLFDRDMEVSSRLVEFRREIASGRIHRRRSHGQSYWVGVA
ncbi:MAG: toxin-antitoxin system HicB family antitoxin [Longimicrobiales bacterium]|nr:toxin-antitoxin system HicB family antitoxin [Longimicrobiales bacterium]